MDQAMKQSNNPELPARRTSRNMPGEKRFEAEKLRGQLY